MARTAAGRPVPLVARLNYSKEQLSRLEAARGARTRPEVKAAMQAVHDELAAALTPQLEALRDDGVIVDFATSWMLGELVVHVHGDRRDAAQAALEAMPELRDVGGGTKPRRR